MNKSGISYPPCKAEENYLCVLWAPCDAQAGVKTVQIYQSLGHAVWYDTTPSSDTVWTGETQRAIANCKVAVLLYSSIAYNTAYFWQCYHSARLLKKPRFILHLEEGRHSLSGSRELEIERWVDPNAEDYGKKIERSWIRSILCEESKTGSERPGNDLGESFSPWDHPFSEDFTVNLRTHEMWDKNRCAQKTVSCEELSLFREKYSHSYLLLPMSFAADYREDEEDRGFIIRKTEAREALMQEKQESQSQASGNKKIGAFPEDYPYMDEFEYLDSQE